VRDTELENELVQEIKTEDIDEVVKDVVGEMDMVGKMKVK
jgi:hypothetical protein